MACGIWGITDFRTFICFAHYGVYLFQIILKEITGYRAGCFIETWLVFHVYNWQRAFVGHGGHVLWNGGHLLWNYHQVNDAGTHCLYDQIIHPITWQCKVTGNHPSQCWQISVTPYGVSLAEFYLGLIMIVTLWCPHMVMVDIPGTYCPCY